MPVAAEFGFLSVMSNFCYTVQNMQAKVSSLFNHYRPHVVNILNDPSGCNNLWKLRKEALYFTKAKVPLL